MRAVLKFAYVRVLEISADDLVAALLLASRTEHVSLLDSCGVTHLGSHKLIAGVRPSTVLELSPDDARYTLEIVDALFAQPEKAVIFTLSYDFGVKLQSIRHSIGPWNEPDLFIAVYDVLLVHDYDTGDTFLTGNADKFDEIEALLSDLRRYKTKAAAATDKTAEASFVSTRLEYLRSIEKIKENIRSGMTYQTNLTQQIRVTLPENRTPGDVFFALRRDHPAPFAAYIKRLDSTVVSASPERLFKVTYSDSGTAITASPIKGTRPRGTSPADDARLRDELLASEKDRAENTMIVDLTRNDLGRICEFGSVKVERLCELEEHPTLFHLVSTVNGRLENDLRPSQIIEALFPCGSISGAPKLSTMELIESLEPVSRGLSMGSIGSWIPMGFDGLERTFEMNVAIRTLTFSDGEAVFNVGGGIVIDSDPGDEYTESLTKATALLRACGVENFDPSGTFLSKACLILKVARENDS